MGRNLTISNEKIQSVSQLLMSGKTPTQVSNLTDVKATVINGIRKKMVQSGLLKTLRTPRKKTTVKKSAVMNSAVSTPTVTDSENSKNYTYVVNNTKITIEGATSLKFTKEGVRIKF